MSTRIPVRKPASPGTTPPSESILRTRRQPDPRKADVIAFGKSPILFVAVVMACSCAPQSKAPDRKVDVNAELRQATQRYSDLVSKMDNAGIAAMFTEDGQLVNSGQKAVRG